MVKYCLIKWESNDSRHECIKKRNPNAHNNINMCFLRKMAYAGKHIERWWRFSVIQRKLSGSWVVATGFLFLLVQTNKKRTPIAVTQRESCFVQTNSGSLLNQKFGLFWLNCDSSSGSRYEKGDAVSYRN